MRTFPSPLRWLFALVVVVTLGVTFWALFRETRDQPRVAGPDVVQPEVAVPVPSEGETVGAEAAPNLEAAAGARAEAEPPDPRVALDPRASFVLPRVVSPGEERTWRGRVEFLGLEDVSFASEGPAEDRPELHLTYVSVGGFPVPDIVEVEGHQWSCPIPLVIEDIASVQIAGVVWRDRLWRPVAGSESLQLDFTTDAVIPLELAPVTSISVVDARTSEPIETFRMRLDYGDVTSETEELSRADWPIFNTRRLELHPDERWSRSPGRLFTLQVSAPGHTMATVDVTLGSGIAHEVRLHRGCSATLRWQREDAEAWFAALGKKGWLKLSVEPIGSTNVDNGKHLARSETLDWLSLEPVRSFWGSPETSIEGTRLERLVEGLAAGSYRATLVHEFSASKGALRIAEASFSLRAGQSAEVLLEDVVDLQAVNVPLELEFDWKGGSGPPEGERLRLYRRNNEAWNSVSTLRFVPGTWRTQPVMVRPGSFRVTVRGLRTFEQEFEFSPDAGPLVVLAAPELQHVRISVATVTQANDAKDLRVRWRFGEDLDDLETVPIAGLPGTSEFHTNRLPVAVSLPESSALVFEDGPWVKLEQAGEHRLVCIEKPRLRLHFRTAGAEARVPLDAHVLLRESPNGTRAAPQKRLSVNAEYPNELRVWLPKPGDYELEFKKLKDFEPIPPLNVNVGARHDQFIEIDLMPKR